MIARAAGQVTDNAKTLDDATAALHTAIQSALHDADSASPSTDTLQNHLQALSALAETCSGSGTLLQSSWTNLGEKWLNLSTEVKDEVSAPFRPDQVDDIYRPSLAKLASVTTLRDDALLKIQAALDASIGELLNIPPCLSCSSYMHPPHIYIVADHSQPYMLLTKAKALKIFRLLLQLWKSWMMILLIILIILILLILWVRTHSYLLI